MRTTIYLAQKMGVKLAGDQVLLRCLPQTGSPRQQARHVIQYHRMRTGNVGIDACDPAQDFLIKAFLLKTTMLIFSSERIARCSLLQKKPMSMPTQPR
jgi:hypothetical protein